MIVVTGGEGFIGRNLIIDLQELGYNNVIPLDIKSESLNEIYDWLHVHSHKITCIFHLGAITDTTETNLNLFDEYNVNCSKFIWNLCSAYNIPLIYASSASTYGNGEKGFDDEASILNLKPLNPYAQSKQDFDIWITKQNNEPPYWYGLKFFNVYGYDESHKGKMASVVYHSFNQIVETNSATLFKSHNPNYKDGNQSRDFIYVKDVTSVCIHMFENNPVSGIYNVGTGKARTFEDLVKSVFKSMGREENIKYVDTPLQIRDKYQYFTEAKSNKLRNIGGYNKKFYEIEDGVSEYVKQLRSINS